MQQIKRTRAVRCPVCGRGRVIDAAADVDPGRLRLYGVVLQMPQVWAADRHLL